MNLLFDLAATQPLSGQYHGGGEYAKSVFAALTGDPGEARISAFYRPDRWLDPALVDIAASTDVELVPAADRSAIQALLSGGRFDRVYSPLPYSYHDLDFSRVQFYYTIHGLRPLELPTDANEARYGRGPRVMARARLKRHLTNLYVRGRKREFARLLDLPARDRLVIAPSLHTKYSLLAHFPSLDPAAVRVYYSPPKAVAPGDPGPRAEGDLLRSLGVSSGLYFLMVSANRWVKNAIRGIEALDRVFTAHPGLPHRALILGAEPGTLALRLANPDRFTFHGYVGAAELELLFARAFALLFPSLNEGFGYPPLEAMRYGTPVVASATGATTEVLGDGVLYVDPLQTAEIEARALTLLLEPGTHAELSERGERRYRLVRAKQEAMLAEMCDVLRRPHGG